MSEAKINTKIDNYSNNMWAEIYDQYNEIRHVEEKDFYYEELKDIKGKILEISCGTGMILLDFLEKDLDMYGVDISAEMLNVLYKKAMKNEVKDIRKRVRRQDMVEFFFEEKFDAIIIPARSFLHIAEQSEQIKCLENIYRHLNENGKLIINFFNIDLARLVKDFELNKEYNFVDKYKDAEDKEIELFTRQFNDPITQIMNINWKFVKDEEISVTTMLVRWIFPEEFKLLLKVAGFKTYELYGSFEKDKFNSKSKEIICIANK